MEQILINTLKRLLKQQSETEVVEFKGNNKNFREIGEYISALANSAILEKRDRAWLVWGIENKTHKIIGTNFNPETEKYKGNQSLEMGLVQSTNPKPHFKFHSIMYENKNIVMLEIFPPNTAPLAFDGERYIRVGSHKTALKNHPDKEAMIFENLGTREDWTAQIVADATIADLDPKAIAFARKKFAEYLAKLDLQEATEVSKWDDITLLNKALVTKQGKITRTALLLLGKDEAQHFLSPSDCKISWILRNDNNQHISGQHFGIPFLLSSEELFRKIRNIQLEYMPDGTLFPTAVSQYDTWVIREALHNCIAHQDYKIGGKINVIEFPDKLIFSNLGKFIPPSIEWMLKNDSPPADYRNRFLVDAMIRLRMIDQMGSGIKRMFETQRSRFFPLPDYMIEDKKVEVVINGKIIDINYTQMLMKKDDLSLDEVVLLDKVQKNNKLEDGDIKKLKRKKLIEGRSPNYYISSEVAKWTEQKAQYIRNRSLDDNFFRKLILELIGEFKSASRQEIDDLLIPKLSEILNLEQKNKKIENLIQSLRTAEKIKNNGTRSKPRWVLCIK